MKKRIEESTFNKFDHKETTEMEQISGDNWSVVAEKPMAVVEFYSQWCGPCKMQTQILTEISQKMNDVFMAKVDIEENFPLTDKLGIKSVPTTIILKNGQEKKRFIGSCPKESIEKELTLVPA